MWRVFIPDLLCVVASLACLLLVWCPGGAALAGSCEMVRIPLCYSMAWNMTKMPNHLHHSTQANAVLAIEQYEALLDTGCSRDLLFFLCAMYAPICTISFQRDPIKPCKSVCERAKSGCEPVLKKYNHTWPESLACDELPVYDRAVCIAPEAIVKAEPSDNFQDPSKCSPEMNPDSETEVSYGNCKGGGVHTSCIRGGLALVASTDRCKCKLVKLNQKTYMKNNYNYVIRARVKEIKTRGHDHVAVVEVKDVLKSSLVHIPRDTVTLHFSSGCLCPILTPNKEYVILGYESEERSRLLLIEGSIAQKWKDRLKTRMKQWEQAFSRERNKESDRRVRP